MVPAGGVLIRDMRNLKRNQFNTSAGAEFIHTHTRIQWIRSLIEKLRRLPLLVISWILLSSDCLCATTGLWHKGVHNPSDAPRPMFALVLLCNIHQLSNFPLMLWSFLEFYISMLNLDRSTTIAPVTTAISGALATSFHLVPRAALRSRHHGLRRSRLSGLTTG